MKDTTELPSDDDYGEEKKTEEKKGDEDISSPE